MKNTKVIIVAAVVTATLFGGAFLLGSQKDSSDSQTSGALNGSNEVASRYVSYSEEILVKAQASGRPVLYFWASWCPTCKVLDQELKENGAELPTDVTILQVNYDTESELKKRYGITQQHTLVQIDKDGNEVEKWIGGGIETIKQQLK